MKLKSFLYLLSALLVIAAVIFYIYNPYAHQNSSDSQSWRTVEVSRIDIGSTVFALGVVKPMVGAEVRVGSRISGVVNRLHANIGDHVEAGAVIAELDDSELRARVAQSRASLEKSRVEYDQARRVFERQKQLFEKNTVSEQEFEIAESSLASAKAQLLLAETNLDLAGIQLSYATIRSPIPGVIASVSTQEGEAVAAGLAAPTFVNIIDLKRLEVQTFVDETDIGKISEGQRATFTVDTFPGTGFPGVVTAIYPKAMIQDNVVNYIVTVAIHDFHGLVLRPEMTANVTITLEERRDVLAIPTSAISRSRGDRFVMVAEGGQHVQRAVKTGWRDGPYTEIIEGLTDGELILIPEGL
ncbi:MAG: efflux RND transporter periplasmic adaptor subunit [Balneolaceae bacterium]|nr:MAG: efflux RND transporter periplasmic adaptor subunit [Balneolaceae bacterium]